LTLFVAAAERAGALAEPNAEVETATANAAAITASAPTLFNIHALLWERTVPV
jgi:hypothetical protein